MKTYNCLNCNKVHNWRGPNFANKYCDNKCQKMYEHKSFIAEWKQGHRDGRCGKTQTSKHLYRYILEKQEYKCVGCGISDWVGKSITLELDHINGDSTNNTESNLRMLCPNCHSQTGTYKAKNIGRGRKDR